MNIVNKIFKSLIGTVKSNAQQVGSFVFTSLTKASDFFAMYNSDVATTKEALTEGYTNPYMFTIVHDLAERMAELPFDLFDYEGEYMRMPKPLRNLMDTPNSYESQSAFLYRLFANALLGDVYIFPISATIGVDNMTFGNLICPLTFCVTPNYNSVNQIDYYTVDYRGMSYIVPFEKMLHIKVPSLFDSFNYDSGFGAGRAAKLFYKASTNQLNAKAGAFGNAGANKLISSASADMPMMPKELEEAQKQFEQRIIGRDKVGKPIFMSTQMQVLDIGYKPRDYMFPEMQEMDIQWACMMFGVAPQLYGSTKSSTYNNMKEAEIARLKLVVKRADKIYKTLSLWLVQQGNLMIDAKACIKVDRTMIADLNTPNLEYLPFVMNIAGQLNRGELSQKQARAMLTEFDYSDAQLDDLLTITQQQNEQIDTEQV